MAMPGETAEEVLDTLYEGAGRRVDQNLSHQVLGGELNQSFTYKNNHNLTNTIYLHLQIIHID